MSAADAYGFHVTHHDFIEATLRYRASAEVAFFLRESHLEAGSGEAVDRLRRAHQNVPIRVFPIQRLPAETKSSEYNFVVPFDGFHNLALARRLTLKSSGYPITSIIHTMPDNSFFGLYCTSLFWAEPGDVLVATSRAGRHCLEEALGECASFLKEEYGASLPAIPEIVDLPLGIEESEYTPGPKAAARAHCEVPNDRILLTYLGRIDEAFKGDLEPLLLELSRLCQLGENVHLLIAGRSGHDRYMEHLESLIEELGVTERITILPNFSYDEKIQLLRATDIFLSLVDNVQETFGVSLLEAMSAGLPIVASDWSGYRDLILDGVTGFLVRTFWDSSLAPYTSATSSLDTIFHKHVQAQSTIVDLEHLHERVLSLVRSSQMRIAFGQAARQRVETHFAWRTIIPKYEELWRFQARERARALNRRQPKKLLDYDGMFSTFASTVLSDDVGVEATTRAFVTDRYQIDLFPIPNRSELIRLVLEKASEGPVSIRKIADAFGDPGRHATSWLLKKGYLRIESTNSAHPGDGH